MWSSAALISQTVSNVRGPTENSDLLFKDLGWRKSRKPQCEFTKTLPAIPCHVALTMRSQRFCEVSVQSAEFAAEIPYLQNLSCTETRTDGASRAWSEQIFKYYTRQCVGITSRCLEQHEASAMAPHPLLTGRVSFAGLHDTCKLLWWEIQAQTV